MDRYETSGADLQHGATTPVLSLRPHLVAEVSVTTTDLFPPPPDIGYCSSNSVQVKAGGGFVSGQFPMK